MSEPVLPDRAARAGIAAATLAVDAVTAEVVTALRASGVDSLLLKGPAVAAWLYGSSEARPYIDVDLLVPVVQQPAAEAVLERLGFHYLFDGVLPVEEPHHARTWVRRTGPSVDLHTTLQVLPAEAPHPWAVLREGADNLGVGGVDVAVPRPACLALIVALHALQRGPDDRRLVDELGRALAVADLDLWREAATVANELHAGGLLRAALGLLPTGSALADELGLPPATVRATILASASYDARACALAFERVGDSASWRRKVSLLSRLLVPTPRYLRASQAGDAVGLVARYRRRWARLGGAAAGYRIWRSAVNGSGTARRPSERLEVLAWSMATRVLLPTVGVSRALDMLDRIRLKRSGGEQLAATKRDPLFRLAGRCLGEAVARSEYLRARGRPHELVLGAARSADTFRAHAWLEPLDSAPADFEVLHRYRR